MALNVGELVAVIDLDNRGWRRGLRASEQDFDRFTRDANGRLHDLQGRFVAEGERAGRGFGFGLAKRLVPGLGAATSAVGGLLSVLGRLAKPLAIVGAAGVATVALQALTGAALGLAGAIAPAAGALLAFPAAGAAAAAGIATLVIGLQGMGDAFKALSEGDAEALQEALADLSPAARQFVLELKALGPQFRALRLDVQEQLFDGLAGQVRRLGHTYLPILRTGLTAIAEDINVLTRLGLRQALDPGPVAATTVLLNRTHQALAAFAPAIQPAVQAMADLVAVGAGALPRLGAGLADVVTRVSTAISQAAASGQLADILNAGIEAAKTLGSVMAGVARVIGDVLSAAQNAGGGMLGTLDQALDRLHAFLSSTEGQTALATFFESVSRATTALMPALLALGQVLATVVAPALADIGQVLLPGLGQLITGLGQAIRAARPGIQAVFAAIGDALPDLVPALHTVGAAIGKAFAGLAPAIEPLAQALGAVATALSPLLPLFGELIGRFLAAAAPVITRVAVALTPVIRSLADQLRPLLPQIAAAFGQLLSALAPVIIALVSQLAPVLPGLISAGLELVNALLPLVPVLLSVRTALFPLLALLVQVITFLLRFAAAIIGPVATGIALLVRGFGALGGAARAAVGVVGAASSGIRSAVAGAVTNAISNVGGLVRAFTNLPRLVGSIGPAMAGAGRGVIGQLFSGMLGALGRAGNFLTGAMTFVVNAVIDLLNRPIRALKSALNFDIKIPIPAAPDPTIRIRLGDLIPTIPKLARGGVFGPGLALVGEQGPELVAFGQRGRVRNARDTADLLDHAATTATGPVGGMSPAALVDAVRAGVLAAIDQARIHVDPTGAARVVATGNLRLARRT